MSDYTRLSLDEDQREVLHAATTDALRSAIKAVRGWTDQATDEDVLGSCRRAVLVADLLLELAPTGPEGAA